MIKPINVIYTLRDDPFVNILDTERRRQSDVLQFSLITDANVYRSVNLDTRINSNLIIPS